MKSMNLKKMLLMTIILVGTFLYKPVFAKTLFVCEGTEGTNRSNEKAYVLRVEQNASKKLYGLIYQYVSAGHGSESLKLLGSAIPLNYESFNDESLIHHFIDQRATIDTGNPAFHISFADHKPAQRIMGYYLKIQNLDGRDVILDNSSCNFSGVR